MERFALAANAELSAEGPRASEPASTTTHRRSYVILTRLIPRKVLR